MQSQKRGLGSAGSPPLLVALIPLEEGQAHRMESLLNTLYTCLPDIQVSSPLLVLILCFFLLKLSVAELEPRNRNEIVSRSRSRNYDLRLWLLSM